MLNLQRSATRINAKVVTKLIDFVTNLSDAVLASQWLAKKRRGKNYRDQQLRQQPVTKRDQVVTLPVRRGCDTLITTVTTTSEVEEQLCKASSV